MLEGGFQCLRVLMGLLGLKGVSKEFKGDLKVVKRRVKRWFKRYSKRILKGF